MPVNVISTLDGNNVRQRWSAALQPGLSVVLASIVAGLSAFFAYSGHHPLSIGWHNSANGHLLQNLLLGVLVTHICLKVNVNAYCSVGLGAGIVASVWHLEALILPLLTAVIVIAMSLKEYRIAFAILLLTLSMYIETLALPRLEQFGYAALAATISAVIATKLSMTFRIILCLFAGEILRIYFWNAYRPSSLLKYPAPHRREFLKVARIMVADGCVREETKSSAG